ncbi:hypothetical protein F183_A52730 [Bryobacterales bacterium F-183]|nr:hypothetical protein F183_A52730 [Bryobacterales bacterium F-183]
MIGTLLLLTILAQATPAPDDTLQDLRDQLAGLRSRILFLEQELAKRTAPSELEFDLAKTGEVRFLSANGALFAVALDASAPDANGIRVRLQITPMNGLAVAQLDAKVEWAGRTKTHTARNFRALLPDRWNVLDIVLPNAVPSDLGTFTLTLTPQQVRPHQ